MAAVRDVNLDLNLGEVWQMQLHRCVCTFTDTRTKGSAELRPRISYIVRLIVFNAFNLLTVVEMKGTTSSVGQSWLLVIIITQLVVQTKRDWLEHVHHHIRFGAAIILRFTTS